MSRSETEAGGQAPPPKEELESSITDRVREEYGDKALEGRERRDALDEHEHHLIRHTTSKLSLRKDVGPGVDAEVTAEVPDTYCFTCREWVGLSGLDLNGTPRSKADAYYLRGPPEAVRDLRRRVHQSVGDIAGDVLHRHPAVDDLEGATEFIQGEIERSTFELVSDTDS